MPMFSKGIVLRQYKEPALSKPLVRFVNPQTDSLGVSTDRRFNVDKLNADQLIAIAKAAQIVDEKDGKLLHVKLQRYRDRAAIVVGDAVDDEPYISSKLALLLQQEEAVVGGLRLCQRVAGCDDVVIMAYKMVTDVETSVPRSVGKIKVHRLRGGYPAQPLRAHLGHGEKLIVSTGALVHFWRAVQQLRHQTTVFVTVAGNCVASPMNLEVSIGMRVDHLLDRCGLMSEPTRVVCGGSMTGFSVMDTDSTLINYTTRGVLAFREDPSDFRYNCIGCGRCERVCPRGLNPMYIHRFVQNSYYANLRPFDAHLCMECGTCSYICPSRLNVAPAVQLAKQYALRNFIGQTGEDDELDP